MIDKPIRLGNKVKFGYSWLVPTRLHHKTATVIDAVTTGAVRHVCLSYPSGTQWMRETNVQRAGTDAGV